uniref:Uncharacterized protein n=1 Tax=Panagrolaimus superbus TaxID=310955 RepID=A0A914YPM0_9BILA
MAKFQERRRSSFVSETQQQQHQQSLSTSHQEYDSSNRYQSDTPSLSRQKRTNSQLLYPPGSTDQIASEHTPAQRPSEKVVYENKPLPPAVVSLNITQASSSSQQQHRLQGRFERQNQPPSRQPEDDYSERLMSPPPGRQTPKSILKQNYSQQQHYSDQEQSWEQSSHISRQQTSNMPEPPPSAFPNPSSNEPSNRNTNRTPAHYGSNYDLDEAENMRVMQENLRKHREQRNFTPQNVPRYPTTSFNGPFFKLEEVTAPHSNGSERPRSQSVAPVMTQEASERQRYEEMHFQEQYNQYHYQQQQQQQQMNQMKNISASEMELNRHNENAPTGDDGVVIWPPPPKDVDRPRPASAMARSVLDPERIDEFRKQKQREMEAMRRRDERESLLHQRQLQAMQIQQQRLYEQRQQLINEQPQRHSYSYPPPPPQQQHPHSIPIQNIPQINTLSPTEEIIDNPIPQYAEDPGPPPPSQMRIFETRPISALSGEYVPDPRETMMSPNALNTWRRTYLVDKPAEVAAKNQIITSEELLEREQFAVDLLKRREAFIEKPEEEPEIFRTGKRWQPPPEKPYIWPTLRRPVTVEPGNEPTVNFAPGPPDEGEYRWQPIVYDPNYKKEKKNFTPTNSPPHSPRRGLGTGPLDDVAKRQTRYVIQPSPDGSHRPRPAFKPARQTPSGGFLPHAPNAVKIVKKRSTQIHNSLSPNYIDQEGHEVEVIHENNFHRLEDPLFRQQTPSQSRSRSLTAPTKIALNDWEKIYDLPPHSSTITNKDPPPNIDVRRRLQLFESQAQAQANLQRRAYSERRNSESTPHHHRTPTASNGGSLLRRVDSRGDSQQHHHHQHSQQQLQHQQHQHHRQRPVPRERTTTTSSAGGEQYPSKRGSRSGTPQQHQHAPYSQSSSSTMPQKPIAQISSSSSAHRHDEQQQHRSTSSTSQRRLQRIIQATQPSPAPPSYERARPYVPPPLPPGYKVGQ